MLGKKTRPVIRTLIIGGTRPEVYNVATSPIKIQSPRDFRNYGAVGVGLGIVAALDQKSGDCGTEIHATAKTLYNQNLNRCHRFPVMFSGRNGGGDSGELDKENYTYVTTHGPNNKSHTRVYYDGCENGRTGLDRRSTKSHRVCLFDISPAAAAAYPVASDYLSSCHMCRKKLHGENIYMYRGEKAFCSTDCRYKQIVMDEKKEKSRSSHASRSAPADDASISPCSSKNSNINGHQIFSAGIFAI